VPCKLEHRGREDAWITTPELVQLINRANHHQVGWRRLGTALGDVEDHDEHAVVALAVLDEAWSLLIVFFAV